MRRRRANSPTQKFLDEINREDRLLRASEFERTLQTCSNCGEKVLPKELWMNVLTGNKWCSDCVSGLNK